MKARTLCTGLWYLLIFFPLFGAEDTKLPFTCSSEDLQWAGMTCPEDRPCPIFLELSAVTSAGGKVFLSGDIHSAETTLYSVLVRSEDNGITWQEPAGRARGEVLDHIQFESPNLGWVSGQRVVPLPGDPFILLTKDGGDSWRKATLLPEGTPGLIQKFHFDSPLSGRVLVDRGRGSEDGARYQLFESKDGAETWKLVQSSASPIPNGPVQEDDPMWRLRADKNGKKLYVERRTAGTWAPTAAFTIQIGECKEE